MTTESPLLAEIRLALGDRAPHARLFRNHVGEAWHGEVVGRKDGLLLLRNARHIVAGLAPGSADLIGWATVVVTPGMVGGRIAVFTSAEVKRPTGGRVQSNQSGWLSAVSASGGFADVVRSVGDALALVRA